MSKSFRIKSLKQLEEQSNNSAELAIKTAKKLGADQAEVLLSIDSGLVVGVRKGDLETLEDHFDKSLAITVYRDFCKGTASTSDLSDKAIKEAVKNATDIAKFTAKDDFSGLPNEESIAWDYPNLNLYYPWLIDAEQATDLALKCESAAFKYDKRIVNSEGTSVSSHESLHVYGNSYGFVGSYPYSSHSISCSVIGKDKQAMQRDYWYSVSRDASDLQNIKEIGKIASKRTIARLDARKIQTGKVPVLFSAETAVGLIGHFVMAIRGASLYRKASFLLDALDKKVFPDWMEIHEQPHIVGGIGSAPFDSEGVRTKSRRLVEDGVLLSYVLDSYSARKLSMQTTGNAGGVHNLIVSTGDLNFNSILKKMGKGLLVTELMGQGINFMTGDYSRGAAGFWVENGEIQFPVEEITIAGNLKEMFQQIVCVGNDVDNRFNTKTGSILIDQMTVAGN